MNFRFAQLIIIIFLDYSKLLKSDLLQNSLDKDLNIRRAENVSVITIGYVAGIEHRPGALFKYTRHGRHISGALTYAIYKLNTLAQNNEGISLLPNKYQLNLQFIETYGEMKMSIQAVANMSVENKVWAIIGPQDTCRTEADIATAYNILMISHFCTDHL